MALRARRRGRQGGSPNRRTTVVGGSGTATFNKPTAPKKGLAPAAAPQKGAVTRPTATYSSVNVPVGPPSPSTPIRTAGSEALRADANRQIGLARTQNRDAIFRAVMNLGDTSLFSKYQNDPNFAGYQFTQDPNSLFAQLARQETQGLEDIDVNSNAGNTFFSGMRLGDRQKLTDETGRQRLAGSTAFGDDLKELAAALGFAESDYERAIADADQMDIDAALERDRVAREEWEAAQAAGPVKGIGQAPPPVVGPSTPQSRNAAYQFQQRMAQQRAEEAARKRARKKRR